MLSRLAPVLVALVPLAAGVVGCGGAPPAAVDRAPTLESRVAVSGNIPSARPADFAGPIRTYRRHVRAALASMQVDVGRLRAAIDAHRLVSARTAWLDADAQYESIGAAYGAFGALDAAINGRPDHLAGGARSVHFTGLHRVELALWGRGDLADAQTSARRLAADVRRLRAHVTTAEIEPLDYALRAHEVLEDSLALQLSGVANRWSRSQLTALRANLRGTDVVYGSLRPMVARRNPGVARAADLALGRLRRTLAGLEDRNHRLPTWDALSQREQETVNGVTAAAAERLAAVPDLIDPRPPRKPKSAFGQESTG